LLMINNFIYTFSSLSTVGLPYKIGLFKESVLLATPKGKRPQKRR